MNDLWLRKPSVAYGDWQDRERSAAGRRGYAPQSVVQHRAMLDRFHRHLVAQGVTIANFDSEHIEAFWLDPEAVSYAPGTRKRYLQLLDRLCRHLVEIGVRQNNPATGLVGDAGWPVQGTVPLFLPEAVDLRLQDFVNAYQGDDVSILRMRAVVALFLGTGITAAEGRAATTADLHTSCESPYLNVEEGRGKPARKIPLEAFAVSALAAWKARREALPIAGGLLFALRSTGAPITDMSLGNIVRDAFRQIGYEAADMSPRILRNTYGRRALLAGMPRDQVSRLLGLASNHTCDRIMTTIDDRP
ncbi:integrase [Cupriavidus sp. IDO]|nr:integrase [Cupriavidus sp. IDO]